MHLTPRQEQIVRLVAVGLGDKEIAGRLGLAPNTVRTHLQRLFREYGLHNRAEAAAKWVALRDTLRAVEPRAINDLRVASASPRVHWWWSSSTLPLAALIAAGLVAVFLPLQSSSALLRAPFRPTGIASSTAGLAVAEKEAPLSGSTQATSSPRSAPVASVGSAITAMNAARVTPRPSLPTTRLADGQLSLANSDRAQAGLLALDWNSCLASIASQNAQRLAVEGYLMAINGPASAPSCLPGSLKVGENVGYWSSANDAQLNAIFMADPLRRDTILGPYKHLGAAWAAAPNGVSYLVVEFG